MKTNLSVLLASFVLFSSLSPAFAALEPVSPIEDATVALVPEAQKTVMKAPTPEARIQLLKEDSKSGKKLRHDKFWRKSTPFVLEVKTTQGEKGPWKVMIGRKSDLSDARIWYLSSTKNVSKSDDAVRIEVPWANLEIASRYYWKVVGREAEGGKSIESPVASFVTEDFAPRWIALEGRVGNVRDLGGRLGLDGRRVRQGLVYRGQGLNENSITGEAKGRNRLTVEDVAYLTGTLGIRTDLDLRSKVEIADMTSSPLGDSVKFIWRSSPAYAGIFTDGGRKVMAENFRVFCDRANYPIYFHCIAGADRTGSLAYVLNGALGVDRHELETDWESTFYHWESTFDPQVPDGKSENIWLREQHFSTGFAKYGEEGMSWNDRIVLYLKDCGITDAEIEAFRGIMLEEK